MPEQVWDHRVAFEHQLVKSGLRKWSVIVTVASGILLIYGLFYGIMGLVGFLFVGSSEQLRAEDFADDSENRNSISMLTICDIVHNALFCIQGWQGIRVAGCRSSGPRAESAKVKNFKKMVLVLIVAHLVIMLMEFYALKGILDDVVEKVIEEGEEEFKNATNEDKENLNEAISFFTFAFMFLIGGLCCVIYYCCYNFLERKAKEIEIIEQKPTHVTVPVPSLNTGPPLQ